MSVCAFVQLSNQGHLLLRPVDVGQLALFMAHVHSSVAGVGVRGCAGRERLRRTRRPDVVLGHEGAREESRLRYLLAQAMKAGLAPPRAWPAIDSSPTMAGRGALRGVWVNRSALRGARSPRNLRASRKFTYREVLELSPLPSWDRLSGAQRRARTRRLIGQIEEDVGLARGGAPNPG
jgi:hypothetical protein